jgi:hypothetical protein
MVEPNQSTLNPKSVVVGGKAVKVHYNWLRIMYACTIVVAGVTGLLYLISPSTYMSLTGFPSEEPIFAGVAASVWVAFALLSILGLWSPLKFVPVLLLGLTYKSIWFIAIIIPRAISGTLPSYAIPMSIIFAAFIIGELIAIPFNYIFAKD